MCRRNFIDRYGKPRHWKQMRRLYGYEKRAVDWGMRQCDFAKLKWYRVRPAWRLVILKR